jgi:lipopolysaccharide export system protein LptC
VTDATPPNSPNTTKSEQDPGHAPGTEGGAPGVANPDGAGQRWRRKVWLMKVIFPLIAVSLVALVGIWSQWQEGNGGFKVGFSLIQQDEAKTLRMINARFAGTNKNAEPYLLTADEAIQDAPGADIIRLKNPKGDITTHKGIWVALTAPQGKYSQSREILDLSGGVTLFHDSGMEFTSATAQINLKAGTAEGFDPVAGQGPSIDVTGEGFKVLDQGMRIIFTGKSKAMLYPKDKRQRQMPDRLATAQTSGPKGNK